MNIKNKFVKVWHERKMLKRAEGKEEREEAKERLNKAKAGPGAILEEGIDEMLRMFPLVKIDNKYRN